LKRSSKDLRLVAYLILARQSRLGPADLAFGLTLLADTLDTYPEALHPRRPKPRQIFLNWLIEKLAAALQLAAAAPRPLAKPANNLSPAANFLLQKAAATRLSAVLQERFGDAAPSTRPLRDAIEALAPPPEPTPEADPFTNTSPTNPSPTSQNNPQTISQTSSQTSSQTLSQTTQPDAATTPPTPSQPRTAESTTPPTPTATTEPSPPTPAPIHVQSAQSVAPSADLSQLDRFLDATDDALAQTARALREAIPTDPRAYRLLRIGLWLKLTAPPAAKPDGTTGVLPLPDRDREALFQLHAKQQWPALLQRSENFLTRHRYLLDLQRLSHAALTGLGPDYAPAALALRAELTALLLRFPTLPFLRDRDGAPLADPDTQTWLTHQIPTSTSTTTPTNPPLPLTTPTNPTTLPLPLSTSTDPASDPFWHDLPARLRSAPHQTLTEAQAHLDQSPTGHHRFTRALTLAEALLNAGDPQRAAYLFAGLAADADRHHLDRWDLLLLIRCLQGAAHAHHLTNNLQARDQTLQRLAPLAPTLETLSLCWLDL
jgi:type VI secretion system protein VasJ